jgi:hypothetical protein
MGFTLIIFGGVLVLAAVVAWAWIPEVQSASRSFGKPLINLTLEQLGEGKRRAESEGEIIGFRLRLRQAFLRRRNDDDD